MKNKKKKEKVYNSMKDFEREVFPKAAQKEEISLINQNDFQELGRSLAKEALDLARNIVEGKG